MTPAQPASQPAVTVRRATQADAERLAGFYRQHFTSRLRLNDDALWKWEFASQPGASDRFPFFVLESDGHIEGGIGYVRFDLRVDALTIAGIHPVNYFVNSNFKGLHALRLFRAVLAEAPVVIGSYVSDSAMPLLKRSGFVDLSSHFHSYHFSLRTATSSVRGAGKVRHAAVVLFRRLWLATVSAVTRMRAPKIRYEISDKLDANWLSHVESWRLAGCCIVKNSSYLAWRYANNPVLDCRYVWQFRGEIPIALAIMHLDAVRSEAVLLDFMGIKDDLWQLVGLIGRTMVGARHAGATLWTTHALSPDLNRALQVLGCGRSQSSIGINIFCADEELRRRVVDPNRWHFMIGDTDVY